jgi:membrane fusion protein (multidrug efflux system)
LAKIKGNRLFVMMLVAGGLIAGSSYLVYEHFTFVSTDNAQVNAHLTMLSSKVNGTIKSVLVDDHQHVKAGDVLAQIDTADYNNASEAAGAQVASLDARYKEAEINYRRTEILFRSQAVSRDKYDQAQATFRELQARLKMAQAQREQASLNVDYTKVVAPTDGIIARKSVEVGQFVPAGQALFGFVETDERWVTANLKETELSSVRPGHPVAIEIDAIPRRKFEGKVESIGPSTGAVFSLLPPDNSTGNFTKVVQRVPVKIKLLNLKPADAEQLQAGLSANVAIRIR